MNAHILIRIIGIWNFYLELVAVNILQYEDRISGDITSPGYPGNYPHNSNYTWIIRTGRHSAKVIFRIIEMNIKEWAPCDDYLEIAEIEPYFRLFKQCGHLKEYIVSGRGKKIRVSFISKDRLTDKGFNLTWRVTLQPTEYISEIKITTQKMLASMTKYRERTSTKKKDVKTTGFEQNTKTSFLSQVQAKYTPTPMTTESPTEHTSTYKYFSPTTSATQISESPSTAEISGRTTNQQILSELPPSLSIQHLETMRATLQKTLRPRTLAATTRSSSVEVSTFFINSTTKDEDKNTFNIQIVYLVVGSLVFEFFLLLVFYVCLCKCRKQDRSSPKNYNNQDRNLEASQYIETLIYGTSTSNVYETIPFNLICGRETYPEDNTKESIEQTTSFHKCKRNVNNRANPAMKEEDYTNNVHTFETEELFDQNQHATHSLTQQHTT